MHGGLAIQVRAQLAQIMERTRSGRWIRLSGWAWIAPLIANRQIWAWIDLRTLHARIHTYVWFLHLPRYAAPRSAPRWFIPCSRRCMDRRTPAHAPRSAAAAAGSCLFATPSAAACSAVRRYRPAACRLRLLRAARRLPATRHFPAPPGRSPRGCYLQQPALPTAPSPGFCPPSPYRYFC